MALLKYYIKYLQEREWDEDPKNSDDFDDLNYEKGIGTVRDINIFNKMRHDKDPKLSNIYLKNVLGDYKGRVDSYNVTSDKMPFGKNVDAKVDKILSDYKKISKIKTSGNDSEYDDYENSPPGEGGGE
jgi:hypothetical protein